MRRAASEVVVYRMYSSLFHIQYRLQLERGTNLFDGEERHVTFVRGRGWDIL